MINVTRSSMPSFEEFSEEIRELWDSRWLTNMGVKHRQLEAELKQYLGVPELTLFSNGHLALEGVIAAMGLPEGGEVITTPFTFASTTHAIVRCGLVPVFCDINDRDYTIDAAKIEALITEKTCAIVPVHVYGSLCDVDAIGAIAKKHGLRVIYDAAHAFGVTRNGVSSAAFGDASMFSFHATKVFNTVEGGAVAYGDSALTQPLNDMKNFGIRGPESVNAAGGNAKMSELHAAMGLCNLRHVDEEIARREQAAMEYGKRLGGVEGIALPCSQPGVKSNFSYYPVAFDGYRFTRDEVFERLKAGGVMARKYFYPLTSDFECYRGTSWGGGEKTPVAQRIASQVLCLPMYAGLTAEDIEQICGLILGRDI